MRSRGSSLPLRCTAAGRGARQPRNLFRTLAILSLPRQECPSLADFLSLSIGVLREVHQLAEILGCLLAVACAVGRAGGAPIRAEPIRGLLERGLVFLQGSCGLTR